jgi:hypothetical protein
MNWLAWRDQRDWTADIYIGAFDRHQRMPPDERRDRAKVNEAVRDGLRLGPLRPAGSPRP